MDRIGLIAGNGRLPWLFAEAASKRGLEVIAVAHRGETDPGLSERVAELTWVRLGQLKRIAKVFRAALVRRAVMAGGIDRVRAWTGLRPDLGGVQVLASLKGLRDDSLLRGIAGYFERQGIAIGSATEWLPEVLAPKGHLAGPPVDEAKAQDVALGVDVARALGQADIGQTVIVKSGQVLAVEAIEGTDAAIRRAMALGGAGAVVVKLCKPGQDLRFDLPTVGAKTLALMAEGRASVLAIEAGKTVLLDAPEVFNLAQTHRISLLGV